MHGLISYFRQKGFRVLGIDRNPEATGRHFVDLFFEIPGVGEDSYQEKIIEIIKEYKVDVFISWLDPEIIFWNEKYFMSFIPTEFVNVFAFNFRRDIMDFFDKYVFYLLIEERGFERPKTFLLGDGEKIKGMNFPLIIKPRIGYGAKNTFFAEDAESLEYYRKYLLTKFGHSNGFLVQEFIQGVEYTVDFFAEKGRVINSVSRKRLEHKGVSLRGEIATAGNIEKLLSDFVSAFNIDGLNNLQTMLADGKAYTLDFNPRPSGTLMFSVTAGVDMLNNLLEKSEGKKITKYGPPRNLKMIRYLSEYYYE